VHLHDLADRGAGRPAKPHVPVLAQVTPAQRHAAVLGVADAGDSGAPDRYADPVGHAGSGASQRPKQSRVPQARSIGSSPVAPGRSIRRAIVLIPRIVGARRMTGITRRG
jgi:hypothetical protein